MSIIVERRILLVGETMWMSEEFEGDRRLLRVGLTEKVQRDMNPVEFIRMLPEGRYVARGHPFGSIESGRKIMLLRAPVTGIIAKVNERVRADPTLINRDPYGDGWLIVIEPLLYEEEIGRYSTQVAKR